MDFIRITPDNLEKEHICCAISNNKDCQVMSKKSWLKDRLEEGLVFLKADVRGKCFIEYIPAEFAWAPISARNYMYIDCLWVSGQFKGQGYSNQLLDACIADSKAQGKLGLVVLSSKKKQGFLSDPKYMRYKGFRLADSADPYFELLYLPFTPDAPKPSFHSCVNHPPVEDGLTLYYTSQCPFTAKYVPILQNLAEGKGAPMHVVHLESAQQAQTAPCPFTTFSLWHRGTFLTHEILSEKKFEKLLMECGY